ANMSEKRTAALLNDSIFAAIHDAFLLGSSLAELKGRIQVAACNSALVGSITVDKGTSTLGTSPVASRTSSVASPPSASAAPKQQPDAAPKQQPGATSKLQPNVINALLKNIVLSPISQGLSAELRERAWTTSVMRAIFQQIVTLHVKCFPNCTTTNTIYD